MSLIFLAEGDITRDHKVDAIVTLINPQGHWYGAVDQAIFRVAGSQYHRQAKVLLDNRGLYDGQVIIAKKLTITPAVLKTSFLWSIISSNHCGK
jgi:O-acetyl-ADP-ribose deacetylase (regulator of RNase III)